MMSNVQHVCVLSKAKKCVRAEIYEAKIKKILIIQVIALSLQAAHASPHDLVDE